MPKAKYYPRGEGIDGRPPTSCIGCGHDDFNAINRTDRNSVRYPKRDHAASIMVHLFINNTRCLD